jgi:hypothetical protein
MQTPHNYGFFFLTAGLLVVTIIAYFWARSSSRKGAPRLAAAKRRTVTGGVGDGAPGGFARAPAPAAETAAAGGASDGNVLAWATFAVSAFGTLSSFVFSLLTYLKSN